MMRYVHKKIKWGGNSVVELPQKEANYRKDTEPFISCFHALTSNTSFQYYLFHFDISLTILIIIFIKSVKYLN